MLSVLNAPSALPLQVFTPTNPMIAGILSLLAELHGIKGLKINNVFSIELLFKAFNLQVGPCAFPFAEACCSDQHSAKHLMRWQRLASDVICLQTCITENIHSTLYRLHHPQVAEVKPTDVLRGLPRERLQNQDWSVDALPAEPTPADRGAGAGALGGAPGDAAGKPGLLGAGQAGGPLGNLAAGLPPSVAAAMGMVQGGAGGLRPGQLLPGDAAAAAAAKGMDPAAAAAAVASSLAALAASGGAPPGSAAAAAAAAAAGAGALADAAGAGLIAQLHNYVVINPSLGAMADRLLLKRHVPAAVDRAIYEILNPVVERSVTIACYTTVELLMKDFALDPDEARMRKAAHLMVSSLAGSLALVTCKDPLRVSLASNLRPLLAPVSHCLLTLLSYRG